MKVFLKQDIPGVGMAGEIIKTSEGYARNYLIPRNMAIEVTSKNEASLLNKVKTIEHRKEVVASKTSMLAEKIKSTQIVLKRKVHGDGKSADGKKLFGSISSAEIADSLVKYGISISKNQVEIDKSIKSVGVHSVTIKLSSTLQPSLTVKVVPEE